MSIRLKVLFFLSKGLFLLDKIFVCLMLRFS